MDVRTEMTRTIERCGGYADSATLIRRVGRHHLRRALREGYLTRIKRDLYVLADTTANDAAIAAACNGFLAGVSAARYHGWEVLHTPTTVTVAVRHHHRVHRKNARVLRRALDDADIVDGIATSPLRTVLDCASRPLIEAVAVADSALRSGAVDIDDLVAAADRSRGPGRRDKITVAALADGGAANPFESAMRVRCLEAGLDVRTQVPITVGTNTYYVDCADRARRLVVEAESFTFHSGPEAFARDCIRYSELTSIDRWTVLRMPYDKIVGDPQWCAAVLGCFV